MFSKRFILLNIIFFAKFNFSIFICSQTLTKFNKETYGNIIETAILAFHCPAEELDMDNLKALEGYLKISKNKYHALVNVI